VILFLQGAAAFGAVETYVVDVIRGLRAEGRAVAIAYPDVPELAPFSALAAEGVTVIPLDPARVQGPAPRVVVELRSLMRRLRPDVVHVTDVWPAAQVAARIAGIRRLFVTHHTPELVTNDNLAGRVLRALGWAVRPRVIYTSETDRTNDARSLRTHVVYYGIDLDRFSNARPAFEFEGGVVGEVARLVPQKGLDVLIRAAPLVLERHADTHFVVAGEGPARLDLEQQITEAGLEDRFVLTGHRTDVPELLASFDVFVLPSRFEGLCYAVIEAQAAGLPVVATPVGGVRENVIEGETGILCAVDDPQSLAAGIIALLDRPDEARRMGGAGRRRALDRYARSRMVAETIALYGVTTSSASVSRSQT
jgi:glycosyltransferase involved in cell wall biosynthesis